MTNKKQIQTIPPPEKVLLAAIEYKNKPQKWPVSESLSELAELTRSVGAEPLMTVTQKLNKPSSSYLGKGKIIEIKNEISKKKIKTVIIDDELNPSQQKTLEDKLKVKVIDRTALILDVFAKRAKSREGKLQVNLAQNEYLLPRLAGQWSHLERLGGGIGTRGPGETQIETDRRLVRSKLSRIKNEIKKVQSQRRQQRALRKSNNDNSIALVGYTNAGKSAIFNRLTLEKVIEKNQLFSTLDTTTRKINLNSKDNITISDYEIKLTQYSKSKLEKIDNDLLGNLSFNDKYEIFIILIEKQNGEIIETTYKEETSHSEIRTITIDFEDGDSEIQIIGTYVIPEFGTIVMIILTMGIMVSVLLTRNRFQIKI